jgi:2,4-dienoyl-CoA reductase-like NADH-dependent reductase (Old Yellow Enzyme family)
MGVREDLAAKFLDHPFYSPRHQSIIVSCLEALSRAKRRDRFLTAAMNALSEEEALFYQQVAELYRAYNEQGVPIVEIKTLGRMPVGRSKEGSLFFGAPIDYAMWMEKTEALFDRLTRTLRPKKEAVRVELWVTGTVSPRVRQELLNRGIVARENMAQVIQLAD